MSIEILVSGILLFIGSLFIHAFLWRIRFPRRPAVTLFFIFFILPALAWSLYLFLVLLRFLPAGYVPAFINVVAILLLHYSLSSAYILSYPAVEAISPSLAIALFMGERGYEATYDELVALFPDESILMPRVKDLINSKCVTLNNETLTLRLRGRVLLGFFIAFRSFIGLKQGRG